MTHRFLTHKKEKTYVPFPQMWFRSLLISLLCVKQKWSSENSEVWEWKTDVWIQIEEFFLDSISKIQDTHMPTIFLMSCIVKLSVVFQ
jgi:hypothetical protein